MTRALTAGLLVVLLRVVGASGETLGDAVECALCRLHGCCPASTTTTTTPPAACPAPPEYVCRRESGLGRRAIRCVPVTQEPAGGATQ